MGMRSMDDATRSSLDLDAANHTTTRNLHPEQRAPLTPFPLARPSAGEKQIVVGAASHSSAPLLESEATASGRSWSSLAARQTLNETLSIDASSSVLRIWL